MTTKPPTSPASPASPPRGAQHSSLGTPSAPPPPVGQYAYTRRVGNLLFLAGIGPRQAGTKAIPGVRLSPSGEVIDYDIEAQVRSCFANVKLVLEQAGSSWDKIVDVTVYLTDIRRDFAAVNRLWAEYFPNPALAPCRTTVEIAGLPQAGSAPINFEVKVVATAE